VLAAIFFVSAVISQFISNTSAALVMMPIGVATASELGVSALPLMLAVAMGSPSRPNAFLSRRRGDESSLPVPRPGANRHRPF
jgi:hypothetical protein